MKKYLIPFIVLIFISSAQENELLLEIQKYLQSGTISSLLSDYKHPDLIYEKKDLLKFIKKNKIIFTKEANEKFQDYLDYGFDFFLFIKNLENKSTHIFVKETQGSMRNPFLSCFPKSKKDGKFYKKWVHNADVLLVFFKNKLFFLSIYRDFENWRLGGVELFKFKKNYLHKYKNFSIKYSDYKAEKFDPNSFSSKNKIINNEIINKLYSFENLTGIEKKVDSKKITKIIPESIMKNKNGDAWYYANIPGEDIYFYKNIFYTSVGHAPNNLKFELYDKNGRDIKAWSNTLNDGVVFTLGLFIKKSGSDYYFIQFSYYDKDRSIDATKLKLRVFKIKSIKKLELIDETKIVPKINIQKK